MRGGASAAGDLVLRADGYGVRRGEVVAESGVGGFSGGPGHAGCPVGSAVLAGAGLIVAGYLGSQWSMASSLH
jgi:hypothetical protein